MRMLQVDFETRAYTTTQLKSQWKPNILAATDQQ